MGESQYRPAEKVESYTWTLTNLSHFLTPGTSNSSVR